jgi:hypothetical protein
MIAGWSSAGLVLNRADNAAVAVGGPRGYPNGSEFTVHVRLRQRDSCGAGPFDSLADPRTARTPERALPLGVLYATGCQARTLSSVSCRGRRQDTPGSGNPSRRFIWPKTRVAVSDRCALSWSGCSGLLPDDFVHPVGVMSRSAVEGIVMEQQDDWSRVLVIRYGRPGKTLAVIGTANGAHRQRGEGRGLFCSRRFYWSPVLCRGAPRRPVRATHACPSARHR